MVGTGEPGNATCPFGAAPCGQRIFAIRSASILPSGRADAQVIDSVIDGAIDGVMAGAVPSARLRRRDLPRE